MNSYIILLVCHLITNLSFIPAHIPQTEQKSILLMYHQAEDEAYAWSKASQAYHIVYRFDENGISAGSFYFSEVDKSKYSDSNTCGPVLLIRSKSNNHIIERHHYTTDKDCNPKSFGIANPFEDFTTLLEDQLHSFALFMVEHPNSSILFSWTATNPPAWRVNILSARENLYLSYYIDTESKCSFFIRTNTTPPLSFLPKCK